MGAVYAAVDTHLDRLVAVKVLPHDKVADPERKSAFHPRSQGRLVAPPSQHRRHPRHRHRRRPRFHRHGARRGAFPRHPDRPQGPEARRGPRLCRPDRRWSGQGPRRRASSTATSSRRTSWSRPRAWSKSSISAWPSSPRATPAGPAGPTMTHGAGREAPDGGRLRRWDRGVHVARAGRREKGRPPVRHLLLRHGPLRDAHRPQGLRPREPA